MAGHPRMTDLVIRGSGMDTQTLSLNDIDLSDPVPVIALSGAIAFPGLILAVPLTRPEELRRIRSLTAGVVIQMIDPSQFPEDSGETDSPRDIRDIRVGVAARVLTHLEMSEDSAQVVFQGMERVEILDLQGEGASRTAIVRPFPCMEESADDLKVLSGEVLRVFKSLVDHDENLSAELSRMADRKRSDPSRLADFMASSLQLSALDRQAVIEASCVSDRLRTVAALLDRKFDGLRLEAQIQEQARARIAADQKQRFLREQLREIKKALGESMDTDLVSMFERRLSEAPMPGRMRQAAETELHRLKDLSPASIEYDTSRHHAEALLDVPWGRYHRPEIDLDAFEARLNEDLVGLEKAKAEIVEFISVLKLNHNRPGSALCIMGPSGIGRGVIARSIARGLGRPFVKINLESMKGADDLVGRRHTAVGAEPGRLVKALMETDLMNPVLFLEGLDALGPDVSPRMISGLLSILDPARRSAFLDEFLGVPFDLDGILVLASAVTPYTIPEPFLDALQLVGVSSYIDSEKTAIARRHLIPSQLEKHGLEERSVNLTDEALLHVIRRYTREAGVWQLNRALSTLCRKLAREAALEKTWPDPITPDDVSMYLGRPRILPPAVRVDTVGVAMGLAWTSEGGDILPIEAIRLPGAGEVQLTGQLGDVMRESAAAALSYVRSRATELDITPEAFGEASMHINLPEGAIPKDGPSAGLTLAVVIASLMTNRPVRHDVAMTGEITLRGRILAVGGIREKILGAHRAGIKTVIMPAENVPDLDDVPEAIQKDLRFVPVETADQGLEEALARVAIPSSQECVLYREHGDEARDNEEIMEVVLAHLADGESADKPRTKPARKPRKPTRKPAAAKGSSTSEGRASGTSGKAGSRPAARKGPKKK